MTTIYDYSARDIHGNEVKLETYRGKVLLIVNTASNCGFTPQYKELEKLYQDLQEKGLVVLGFPCNQFGKQEPGNDDQISEFCELNFGVSFPLFSKIDVNGPDTHPLYRFLKEEAAGILDTQKIKWNFTKFLVDHCGNVVKRFAPIDKPQEIRIEIEKLF